MLQINCFKGYFLLYNKKKKIHYWSLHIEGLFYIYRSSMALKKFKIKLKNMWNIDFILAIDLDSGFKF